MNLDTGGSGFIASRITTGLVAQGERLRVLERLPSDSTQGVVEVLGIPSVYYVENICPNSVIRSGFLPRCVRDCREQIIDKGLDGICASAAAVVIAVYLVTPIIFASHNDAG
jgi:nucleoside-diphosphate-sugar epimerase